MYGAEHRIIIYHSSGLERKRTIAFMKRFGKIYRRVKRSLNQVILMKWRGRDTILRRENLNETILLPTLAINGERVRDRISTFGRSLLFTNVGDTKSEDLVDLYRKRNRVKHCFRTISMSNLASPIYHLTPQKIRVHMFFSDLAYLFLSLIYNSMRQWISTVSLISSMNILGHIRIVYAVRGSKTVKMIDAKIPDASIVAERMKLLGMTES